MFFLMFRYFHFFYKGRDLGAAVDEEALRVPFEIVDNTHSSGVVANFLGAALNVFLLGKYRTM